MIKSHVLESRLDLGLGQDGLALALDVTRRKALLLLAVPRPRAARHIADGAACGAWVHLCLWRQTQGSCACCHRPRLAFGDRQQPVEPFQAAIDTFPFGLELRDLQFKQPRAADMPQNATRIGYAARVNQPSGSEPTTSRQTVACASVNSEGGAEGMHRPASITTVDNSADDILPRFPWSPPKILDVYDAKPKGPPPFSQEVRFQIAPGGQRLCLHSFVG